MATALSCLFLSGAASLFYEVCWIRKAELFFGSTTFALATVLAVFFLGLALGSALAGRLATSLQRPLRIYGIVELAIAGFGLASNTLLDVADDAYGVLYRWADGSTPWIALARLVLVAAVILVPTILMGATVPLLAKATIRRHRRLGFAAGGLYGLNALGAATGAALAGFVTLPVLGLAATIHLGAGLNVLCGVAVLLACGQTSLPPLPEQPETDAGRTLGIPALLPLFFLTGFVGVAIEILWVRYLPLMITSSVHAYTLPLVVVLLGIGIGSLVIAPLCDRSRHPVVIFGILQALTGLSVLVAMKLPRDLWTALGQAAPELISSNHFTGLHCVILLPGALASGASFPLVVRLVSKKRSRRELDDWPADGNQYRRCHCECGDHGLGTFLAGARPRAADGFRHGYCRSQRGLCRRGRPSDGAGPCCLADCLQCTWVGTRRDLAQNEASPRPSGFRGDSARSSGGPRRQPCRGATRRQGSCSGLTACGRVQTRRTSRPLPAICPCCCAAMATGRMCS